MAMKIGLTEARIQVSTTTLLIIKAKKTMRQRVKKRELIRHLKTIIKRICSWNYLHSSMKKAKKRLVALQVVAEGDGLLFSKV